MSEIKKYMNGKTLKFCPCCNGIAILDESEAQIRCIDCGLTMDITKCFSIGGSWKEAVEEAVAKWNTRKPMERIVERLNGKKKTLCGRYNHKTPLLEMPSCKIAFNNGICESIQVIKEEGGIDNE